MHNKSIGKIKDITSNINENIFFADEDCPNGEIKNVNLERCLLVRLGMKSKRIYNSIFLHCIFKNCYFKNAQFNNVNFTGSYFKECNFTKTTFKACCFWYAQFSRCHINYDEILQSIPSESNIAIQLLQSLRQNAIEMGEKKVANKILTKEIEIQKRELMNHFLTPTDYYKKKYNTFERVRDGLKFLGYSLSGFVWGYGLKLKNLLLSAIVTIFSFSLLFIFWGSFALNNNCEIVIKLNFVKAFYLSTITFTTLGYGDFIPISPVTYFLCALESFIGVIFLGFLAATVYRKFSK